MKINFKELRINRYKAKRISKYIIIVAIILVAVLLFPSTLSMYSSNGEGTADVEIAYSLLNLDPHGSTIRLDNVVPSDMFSTYTFSIKNTDDEGNRIDVNLKYYVEIKTTTNLPMLYELYDNENRLTASNYDHITDEDGTHWYMMRSREYVATFNADIENTFTLKYRLPSNFKNSELQDISELIMIRVHAEQIVE